MSVKKTSSGLYFVAIALLKIIEVARADKYSATLEFNGEYYHYEVTCGDKPVDYYDTLTVCKSDHPDEPLEWVRGSVPSKDANDLLSSLSDEGIWIGGFRKPISDTQSNNLKWVWPGHKQTTKVQTFAYTNVSDGSVVGSCAPGMYCNFVDGALTTLDVKCGSHQKDTKALILLSKADSTTKERQWGAVPGDICAGVPKAKCYSCQKVDDEPGPSPLWSPTAPTSATTATNTTTRKLITTTKFSPPMTSIIVSSTTTEIPSSTATTTEAGLYTTITAKEPAPSSTITTTFFPETKNSENKKNKTPGVVLGSIIGAAVLIGLILLVVFLIRKKSNKGKVISIV